MLANRIEIGCRGIRYPHAALLAGFEVDRVCPRGHNGDKTESRRYIGGEGFSVEFDGGDDYYGCVADARV